MTVRVETTEATQSNARIDGDGRPSVIQRSEEHTSELQSRLHLVCRLLLEKKKVNRCGRRRHLERKLSLRMKRTSQHVFEMAATENITSIILLKTVRHRIGTVRRAARSNLV